MNTACSIFGLIGVILDFLKLGYRTPTYERYKNGYDNSPEAIFWAEISYWNFTEMHGRPGLSPDPTGELTACLLYTSDAADE